MQVSFKNYLNYGGYVIKLATRLHWRIIRGIKQIIGLRFKGLNLFILGSYGLEIYKDVETLCLKVNDFGCLAPHIPQARELYARYSRALSGQVAPAKFDSAEELAVFLYAYVIAFKPRIIIETGVANGISTNMIMSALEQYQGVLHSFDINPKCAFVYSGSGNWNFHLLKKNYAKQLKSKTQNLKNVDLWIHDSDHSYSWQKFEYSIASQLLTPNSGMLVSDDVDTTSAFGKFSKKNGKKSWAIFDTRKFFAFTKLSS